MASTGKKTGIIIGVLVILGVIAFGAIRYMESTVVKMIQNWVAQTPAAAQVTLDTPSYSLLQNTLLIPNFSVTYNVGPQKVTTKIALIEVNNLNSAFVDLLSHPEKQYEESEMAFADSVLLKQYTTLVSDAGQKVESSIDERAFKNLRVDAAAIQSLLTAKAANKDEWLWKLMYAFSYEEGLSANIVTELTSPDMAQGKTMRLTIGKSHENGFNRGNLDAGSITAVRFNLGKKELVSIDAINVDKISIPPAETLQAFVNLTPDASDEETLELLRKIFLGPKPLMEKFEVRGLKLTATALPLSVESLNWSNTSTSPFTCGIAFEHAIIPTSMDPDLAMLGMLGLKDVDASGKINFIFPTAKAPILFNLTALDIADLGSASLEVKTVFPLDAFADFDAQDMENSLQQETEKAFLRGGLAYVKGKYTDGGLLARAQLLNQKITHMTLAESTAYTQKALQEQIASLLGQDTPLSQQLFDILAQFMNKPGTVTISFAPPSPMPLLGLLDPTGLASSIKVAYKPGEKTLEEEIKALQ